MRIRRFVAMAALLFFASALHAAENRAHPVSNAARKEAVKVGQDCSTYSIYWIPGKPVRVKTISIWDDKTETHKTIKVDRQLARKEDQLIDQSLGGQLHISRIQVDAEGEGNFKLFVR